MSFGQLFMPNSDILEFFENSKFLDKKLVFFDKTDFYANFSEALAMLKLSAASDSPLLP